MPSTVLQRRDDAQVPPDMAAVLADMPIHPQLLRNAPRPSGLPTASALIEAALRFATAVEIAAPEIAAPEAVLPDMPSRRAVQREQQRTLETRGHEPRAIGVRGIVHSVGIGGVLHLKPASTPRAVSLVRGELEQRCATSVPLRPGAVRLLPAGRALTLADLAGNGALAVEVLC